MISGDDLVGVGHTVPLNWNKDCADLPNTIGEVLINAIECSDKKAPINVLAALAFMVSDHYRGIGFGGEILTVMKRLAMVNDLESRIIPVRPFGKRDYPLMPFSKYINWQRTDGSPFDPWLGVHWKMGALILKTAPKLFTVEGTIKEWENWANMHFADSGEYIVDDALKPVLIDCKNNYGLYEDPRIWMLHTCI